MTTAPLFSNETRRLLNRWSTERRERWRKAGRLWSFTCRAVPYGVAPSDADLRTYGKGVRYGAFTPGVLDEAVNGTHPAPVCAWHGHYGAEQIQPPEYGRVTGYWDTPVALYLEAFTCLPVQVGQTVSISVQGTRGEWASPDGIVTEVAQLVELSLCSDPGVPTVGAMPGAEVLSVTELTGPQVASIKAEVSLIKAGAGK
ncbi:MAG TPA: hypothetical protein VGE38_16830 [Nocardioides sp.]|uniref:hypothetical protein n=1 Tax=Nocardioides sp. TaxID=35761 RepID=UPI002EDB724D